MINKSYYTTMVYLLHLEHQILGIYVLSDFTKSNNQRIFGKTTMH